MGDVLGIIRETVHRILGEFRIILPREFGVARFSVHACLLARDCGYSVLFEIVRLKLVGEARSLLLEQV
jgi:hypothetical protein